MQRNEQKKRINSFLLHVVDFFLARKVRQLLCTILLGIICGTIAFCITKAVQTPVYSSTVSFAVLNERARNLNPVQNLNACHYLSRSLVAAGKNAVAAEETLSRLELKMETEELLSKVRISSKKKSMIVRVSATDENPRLAQEIAQVYSEELIAAVAEKLSINRVKHLEGPTLPVPSDDACKNAIFAGLLGWFFMLFLQFRRRYIRCVVHNAEELSRLQRPILGEIYCCHVAERGAG